MRYGAELALRDKLKRLAGLERECVTRDVDLDGRVLARADVEARLRRGAGDFCEWGGGGGWSGGFVDEHGGREAGEAAVVEVCGAPVVAIAVAVVVRRSEGFEVAVEDLSVARCFCRFSFRFGFRLGGEVVQEPGLGGRAGLDDVLEVAGLVVGDLLDGEPVAGARDQDRDVDDERDELLRRGPEGRDVLFRRPHVRRRVLFEARVLGAVRALQGRVLVEGAIDVVGALLGVDDARAEGLDAVRPADEVFGGRVGEGL